MRRAFLTLWGPFLAALAVVFCLSSMSEVPGAHYVWDKLLHTFGYAGIGILALRAFHGGFVRPQLKPTLYAALTVIAWGMSDEYHQSFVPGRDASVWDVLADAVGFTLGVLMMTIATLRTVRMGEPR